MSTDYNYKILLEKLIAGTISHKEQWLLEKASLDDPMLEDALEAFYKYPPQANDLVQLKEKIKAPVNSRKSRTIVLRWLSAAASLLALITASYWLYDTTKQSSFPITDTVIAENEDAKNSDLRQSEVSESIAIEQNETTVQNNSKNKPAPAKDQTPVLRQKDLTTASKETWTEGNNAIEPVIPSPDKKTTRAARQSAQSELKREIPPSEEAIVTTSREEELKADAPSSDNSDKSEAMVIADQNGMTPEKGPDTPVIESDFDPERVSQSSGILTNAGPAISVPKIITGIVRTKEGRPIPGAKILDTEHNELANTNTDGSFRLPDLSGYLIAAFAGYDSMTVAIAPGLVIELQESSKAFTEPHKRLVDMMDDTELINHYKNKLNSLFSQHWPVCTTGWQNAHNNNPNSIRLDISIDREGKLHDLDSISNLTENCLSAISDIMEEAENKVFEKGRPISFIFRVNL